MVRVSGWASSRSFRRLPTRQILCWEYPRCSHTHDSHDSQHCNCYWTPGRRTTTTKVPLPARTVPAGGDIDLELDLDLDLDMDFDWHGPFGEAFGPRTGASAGCFRPPTCPSWEPHKWAAPRNYGRWCGWEEAAVTGNEVVTVNGPPEAVGYPWN